LVCLCALQLLKPNRGIGTRGDDLDCAREGERKGLTTCDRHTLGGHSSGGSAIGTSQREVDHLGACRF
jgi:hypothetical protein